jgi:hypothetical protein
MRGKTTNFETVNTDILDSSLKRMILIILTFWAFLVSELLDVKLNLIHVL